MRISTILILMLAGFFRLAAATAVPGTVPPAALLVILGDQHSAYEKAAQLVAHVDALKRDHPGVPLAILINGDSFEYGNVVARRSGGRIDFALFAALVKRAPTVLNLGNHEPDFHDPAEAVARLRAAGVTVISGNARDRANGRPLADAFTSLKLGVHEATIVGLVTSRLDTFRLAIRPGLDLADPVVWARENLPRLLAGARLPIVLSHSGIRADKQILPLVPDGTLFAGAHDHVRFVHPIGRTVYVHSGSWMEYVSLASLHMTADGPRWTVTAVPVLADAAAEPGLAELIRDIRAEHLTVEDKTVVGHTNRALPVAEAGQLAAASLSASAGVDAAFIGNTTFGAGLPDGDVSRIDFDAFIRFDGPVYTVDLSGARLQQLVAAANQGPETPFEQRNGEFNVAGGRLKNIEPGKTYRIATTDWGARNSDRYFGEPALAWQPHPSLRLKAAVLSGLQR